MSIIAVFTTVDSNKFNINGYEVFKIFNSRKVGTNAVDIVNVYDNQQALFQSIRFDEISVDGIVYTNVEDLITNLTPLIYRPASLGNASQGQIDNIQTIIDSLPTTYAGINHDHEGLYLTEQQIRNLNLGGDAGESITSGNVLGNKIRFFNDLQQLVFEIDAKAFLSQGSLLSYNENTGRLTLSNGFAEVLSTQTIRAQNVGFDSFEYVEGIANDLSNLIVGSTFLLVQTSDGTFYFINPNQVELSEDFRLTFINNSLVNDLTVADVSTVNYDGYILTGVNSENYEAGETYLFTFWRRFLIKPNLEQTDANAPDFVKGKDVFESLSLSQEANGDIRAQNTQGTINTSLTLSSQKQVIDLGDILTDTIEDAFNDDAFVTPIVIDALGITEIHAIQNDEQKIWFFVGNSGVYDDVTVTIAEDFRLIPGESTGGGGGGGTPYSSDTITTSRNILEADRGKTLIIGASVTLTFSGTYGTDLNSNILVKAGQSLTIANGDKTLLDSNQDVQTQIVVPEKTFCTIIEFEPGTYIVLGL